MAKQISDLRAKYNTNGNAVIPNTFQHPNIFVDRLMHYLSPIENVVLTFAVRRILGFQSNIMNRKDNISLSQFTDGITAEDGYSLSMGCGVGKDGVVSALDVLCQYNILLPTTEKADPKRGQEYWLQENENNIDWAGLEKRKNEKRKIEYQRTQKARCAVAQNTSVRQNTRGSVPQQAPILSDSNTKPTETHGNPHSEKNEKKSTVQPSDMPEWAFAHGEELTPSQIAEIEENSSRKWKYRESFPSELWPLADLVVKKFGPPIKTKKNNQVSLYLETIGSWHDVGCTIADWPRALEIVKAYSNPIVRITGMTDPLKLAMQERKNRKAPEERQPIPEKQGISRDEALSRGLITHPKIGASS